MNKWTRDYKKYLKDARPTTIDDLYEYKYKQEKRFWIMLVFGAVFIGIIVGLIITLYF